MYLFLYHLVICQKTQKFYECPSSKYLVLGIIIYHYISLPRCLLYLAAVWRLVLPSLPLSRLPWVRSGRCALSRDCNQSLGLTCARLLGPHWGFQFQLAWLLGESCWCQCQGTAGSCSPLSWLTISLLGWTMQASSVSGPNPTHHGHSRLTLPSPHICLSCSISLRTGCSARQSRSNLLVRR